MIEIKNLNKTFSLKSSKVEALKDVSLHIEDGQIYGVIGYSGAGKSTLVRCINLLECPDSGEIEVNGVKLTSMENGQFKKIDDKNLNKARKGIGMIFQLFNLLDRSTVYDNVAYSLKYSKKSKQEIDTKVRELLKLVDLEDKIDAYPSQLSGGQKQRVAIARALANNPKVLLSDEATSALDPEATESILNLLKKLNKELGLTIVLITHEMSVIKSICNRVAVMENGEVVEEGDVYDIFAHPTKPITKKFIGSVSSLSKIDKMLTDGSSLVQLTGDDLLVQLSFEDSCTGDAVISDVSKRFDVKLNIILANVEVIDSRVLGGMVVIINGQKDEIQKATDYLKSLNVGIEVLSDAGNH
ncbi:MAG: ATP-binding cassette domain-containing protein [Erysipelotrichaceae bacterium]|nr:ATP-binding cassette domain-containing protein [Erysipelotrichaceae bacterium]